MAIAACVSAMPAIAVRTAARKTTRSMLTSFQQRWFRADPSCAPMGAAAAPLGQAAPRSRRATGIIIWPLLCHTFKKAGALAVILAEKGRLFTQIVNRGCCATADAVLCDCAYCCPKGYTCNSTGGLGSATHCEEIQTQAGGQTNAP